MGVFNSSCGKKCITSIFILQLVLQFFLVSAQDKSNIDSLVNCLENALSDTSRVDLMIDISEAFRKSKSTKYEDYILNALKLSEKIGFIRGMADSYKEIGIQCFVKGEYSKAIEQFEIAMKFYTQITNRMGISDCYKKIGLTYAYQDNYSGAIENYEQALKIDEAINNKNGIAVCYNDIGVMYNYQGNHVKSLEYQKKSLSLCKEMGDTKAIAARLINLGASLDDQSNYTEAIECYIEALDIKKQLADSIGISMCYNNLGETYIHKGDFGLAIENYEKSLNIDQKLNDQGGISICLLNIGKVHYKQKYYTKALRYYEESFAIAEKTGNKRILTNCLNHMGEVSIKLGNFKEALRDFEKAIALSTELGDKSEIAKSVFNMGEAYMEIKEYHKAIEQFNSAFVLHRELEEKSKMSTDFIKLGMVWFEVGNYDKSINFGIKGINLAQKIGSKENIALASEVLYKAYARKSKYREAFEYSALCRSTNDSIFTIESQKQIALVENRFEMERKQQEIELQKAKLEKQEADIKRQQLKQNALSGGMAGALLLVLLIVAGYIRITKSKNIISRQIKLIEETNEELNQTNEELSVTLETNIIQKEQIEKKNKEITDSIHYAKYIQKTILPKDDKLDRLLPNYFVFYKPKNIVSGDFYWITEIEDRIIVAVADCTGHGVPGAFMSMLGVSFLNEIVNKEYITHPAVILKRLRKEIIHALQQEGEIGEQRDGMDIGLCSFDFRAMELHFSGANSPLYIIRSNDEEPIPGFDFLEFNGCKLYEIKGDNMPIALYKKMEKFQLFEIKIVKGDCIYLFSDGFADQFGGVEKKRFQYKAFKQLLLENCMKPMEDQNNILNNVFATWQDDFEQIDDVLVMGIKV